jgi:outer membrane protein assembly factor BamB
MLRLLALSLSLLAADWPGWRGPNRDGLSPETGLLKQWPADGPQLVWQSKGLGAGFSSLSIAGNRMFTMGDHQGDPSSAGQYVEALNLADGSLVWSTKIGPVWEDDDTGGPRGTPSVDGESVYAMGTEGELVCLDISTGALRWQKSMAADYNGQMMSDWKFAESPLIDGDKLLFTPGSFGALMVAVDKRTGKDLWRAGGARLGRQGSNGAGYSSIVISNGAGVRQYVQLIGRGLIGVRADDGKLLWSYNRVANDVANVATPVVRGDYVFSSTGYRASLRRRTCHRSRAPRHCPLCRTPQAISALSNL